MTDSDTKRPAREVIEHHVGLLRDYLEAVPTPEVWHAGGELLKEEYAALVDGFWDVYAALASKYGTAYYWSFRQATGENEMDSLAWLAQDMWSDAAKELSQKMEAASVEALYAMTDEADMPEEYLMGMGLRT